MADKAQQQEAAVETQEQEVSLLDQILTDGKWLAMIIKRASQRYDQRICRQVMVGQLTMSKNMDAAINARIAEIDRSFRAAE